MRGLIFGVVACVSGIPMKGEAKETLEEWRALVERIEVKSTKDETLQPAWAWIPAKANAEKVPLFVGLHTWSSDMNSLGHYWGPYRWCKANDWALVCPNFRGGNDHPSACGSALAVQDVVDAINWMKSRCRIDPDRVYVMGGSGGGHMALLLAGYAPDVFAGVVAWCAISDLALWHRQVRKIPGCEDYADMMEKSCGGSPAEKRNEYLLRSPRTWLCRARDAGVPVYIGTGIHDGHRPRGYCVPAGQSALAFNELCRPDDRLSDEDIAWIDTNETVRPELAYTGADDPFYPPEARIHFRRASANVQLTYFEGGHDCNYPAGFEWLSRQRRGRKADFSKPQPSLPEIKELMH